MPDPYERHGRNAWEWGTNPGRKQSRTAAASEQLVPAVVAEGKRPPSRKDPKLCKAAHWKGPHQPEIVLRAHIRRRPECRWDVNFGRPVPEWFCQHEEHCAGCGKVLRIRIEAEQCPDFHPVTPEEQPALDQQAQAMQERQLARRLRRPVIDGPQGYRKS